MAGELRRRKKDYANVVRKMAWNIGGVFIVPIPVLCFDSLST